MRSANTDVSCARRASRSAARMFARRSAAGKRLEPEQQPHRIVGDVEHERAVGREGERDPCSLGFVRERRASRREREEQRARALSETEVTCARRVEGSRARMIRPYVRALPGLALVQAPPQRKSTSSASPAACASKARTGCWWPPPSPVPSIANQAQGEGHPDDAAGGEEHVPADRRRANSTCRR